MLIKRVVKNNCFLAFLAFLIPFLIYLQTLCPTVYWGDSGELITAAYTLGIPHPTGYPAYTILAHLFTYLPFGTIAWRVNLMSAFFASLTVLLLYFICHKLTRSQLVSFTASLVFAFLPVFWHIATVAEVYTLHAFFIALNLLLLLHWQEKQKIGWLYLFSFCFGLSLTHHLTSLLLLPVFLYFILVRRHQSWFKIKLNKELFQPKIIGLSLLFFFLGLLPYLYLPFMSSLDPFLDWGNPETPQNFFNHITGKQYTFLSQGLSPLTLFTAFAFFFKTFSFLAVLILVGFWRLRKNKKLFVFLTLPLLILIFFNLTYHIPDITYYFIPVWLFFSLFIAFGWAWLLRYFNLKRKGLILTFSLLFLFVALVYLQFPYLDKSKDLSPRAFSQYLLQSVEPNSLVLFHSGEEEWILTYYQRLENKKNNLKFITLTALPMPWYQEYLQKRWPSLQLYPLNALVKNNLLRFPIYLTKKIDPWELVYQGKGFNNQTYPLIKLS